MERENNGYFWLKQYGKNVEDIYTTLFSITTFYIGKEKHIHSIHPNQIKDKE